jgi:hypothetical protein
MYKKAGSGAIEKGRSLSLKYSLYTPLLCIEYPAVISGLAALFLSFMNVPHLTSVI